MKSWKNKILPCLVMSIGLCSGFANFVKAAPDYNFSKMAIKERIIRHSITEGIDPALALSLVKQESNFEKSAKSHVGAIGLFQLMPQTARDMGVNPYYVNQNIKGGLKYLKLMKNKFGKTEYALAAYNAGPGAVSKYGGVPPYTETRNYVKRIMHNYKSIKENPDTAMILYYKKVDAELALQNLNKVDEGMFKELPLLRIDDLSDDFVAFFLRVIPVFEQKENKTS